MKRPLPLVLGAYIAGMIAGQYLSLPSSFGMAGILGAMLALIIFLFSERKKEALILAPLIFFLFGLIFIGRILHPDFPPNHIIHWAGEKKYQLEGVLYRPSEPMPDKTRLYLRAEKIYLGEGIIPVAGNLLLTVKDRKID
jgi:hypothetical protein